MPAVAFAQVILALLPLVTSGVQHLFAFVADVRAAAQQSAEWPPEAEEAFQRELLRQADSPEALPDGP
jgi:hypothetical protein